MAPIQNRHEFSLLIEVRNGNPNGDPDSDNMPRINPETGHGFMTDVCAKRGVRDYIADMKGGETGYGLYISSGRSLNQADLDAAVAADIVPEGTTQDGFKRELEALRKKNPAEASKVLKEAACAMYYDVRTFGAVMTTYSNAGASQIRGPVQMGFANSIDPISIQTVTITRCVHTKDEDNEGKSGSGTMGHKHIIPYALYRLDGYVSAGLAEKYAGKYNSGFSDADLELLWDALMNMFEHNHSAGRGNMCSRKLVIFKHNSKWGNTQAHKLFEALHVSRKPGVAVASSYDDYEITLDTAAIPDSVTVEIRE